VSIISVSVCSNLTQDIQTVTDLPMLLVEFFAQGLTGDLLNQKDDLFILLVTD